MISVRATSRIVARLVYWLLAIFSFFFFLDAGDTGEVVEMVEMAKFKLAAALEVAKINQLAIDYIYSNEIKLYSKTGSLGQDYQTLVVSCFDEAGNNLFFGTPECLGEHSSSNYAYSDLIDTEPTSSVYQWIKENYPSTYEAQLEYDSYSNWERCPSEATTTIVNFTLENSIRGIAYCSITQESDSQDSYEEKIFITGQEAEYFYGLCE